MFNNFNSGGFNSGGFNSFGKLRDLPQIFFQILYKIGTVLYTPINKRVNTPSKETVMKLAVFDINFQIFKVKLLL